MTIVLLDNNTTNCRKAAMNEKKIEYLKKGLMKHTERFLKTIIMHNKGTLKHSINNCLGCISNPAPPPNPPITHTSLINIYTDVQTNANTAFDCPSSTISVISMSQKTCEHKLLLNIKLAGTTDLSTQE